MAEVLGFSSEVEVGADTTVKCYRKKKKIEGPSDSASADCNASTPAQTQGLNKPHGSSQTRKKKALLQSEKTRIVLSLRDLSVHDILTHAVSEVSSLPHQIKP